MLAELDVHGVVLGHSERRQLYNETDRALSEKVPAALDAGLKPILCVGETEDEREAGDTERKLRHQVQEGLEKLDSARLGDVVIAYEPIWAIGTGLVATPEQAQDAIAFVRALVADRDRDQARAHADPLRGLGQARQRRRAARPARRRRRAGRRRLARRRRLRGHRRGGARRDRPVGLPGRPRRLGDRARRPRQRRLAGRRRRSSTTCGSAIRTAELTTCGTAVGLPEGQMGNSEVGHLNLGAGAVIKQDLTRIDEAVEPTGRWPRTTSCAQPCPTPSACTSSGSSPTAACTRAGAHLEALIAMAAEAARRRRRARLHRRARHAARRGRGLPRAGRASGARDADGARVGSVVGRYWAMDRDKRWERIQKAYDLLVHGRAEHHADSGVEAVRAAYERGETDEFIEPTTVGEEAAHPSAATRSSPSTSAPIACARSRARWPTPRFDEVDRGERRGRAPVRDADRVRGGLALPGRLPAGAPRDHAAARHRRGGRAPAPRRRDREVPARHVLLRRRARRRPRRASGASSCPARATSPPTTRSPR